MQPFNHWQISSFKFFLFIFVWYVPFNTLLAETAIKTETKNTAEVSFSTITKPEKLFEGDNELSNLFIQGDENSKQEVIPVNISKNSLNLEMGNTVFETELDLVEAVPNVKETLPQDTIEQDELPNKDHLKESIPSVPTIPDPFDLEPVKPSIESDKDQNSDNDTAEYIIPPQVIPTENVPPILTLILINDNRLVDHLTNLQLNTNYLFSADRSNNLQVTGITKLDAEVIQSISKDNVFVSDFKGQYLELETINKKRTVTTTSQEPQTLQGVNIQLTFTGSCGILGLENVKPNQQCNLLPTVIVDRNSVDPELFVPTRVKQNRTFGQPISKETLEIISQPGFQNIDADGELIGLDLYFPNIGAIPGNSQSQQTTVSRREEIDQTYSIRHYYTRQVVKANHERAVLGRTVRGLGLILDEDQIFLNAGLTAGGQLLPDVIPKLEGSNEQANTNVNPHLFLAANNTRLPKNSFVIYQAGLGNAITLQPKDQTSFPKVGKFHSIWLGLSPVVERSINTNLKFEATGPEKVSLRVGGEGGADSDSKLTFISVVNSQSFNTELLDDFYLQNYISFLTRDVDFITKRILTEKTNYYPHLSITGNVTGNKDVFRYYGGVIAHDQPKAYVGTDYTRNFGHWRADLGTIAYTNPDKDYFSYVDGSIGRKWQLPSNTNLSIAGAFNYAWNRPPEESILDNPIDNNVSLGATLNVGRVSLNAKQLFDILPNSVGNKIRAGVGLQLGNRASVNAYLTPQRNIDNFGINAEYKISNRGLFQTVIVQWNRSIYDFGEDSFGNQVKDTNDTFSILFNFSR